MKDVQLEHLKKTRESPAYWSRLVTMEFVQGILRIMKKGGVSRSKLAKRYQADPAYITKVLSGSENFTLKTMMKFALALTQLSMSPLYQGITGFTTRRAPRRTYLSCLMACQNSSATLPRIDTRTSPSLALPKPRQ